MKNKDVIMLRKIFTYCDEILETCKYFGNNLDEFVEWKAWCESQEELWQDGNSS